MSIRNSAKAIVFHNNKVLLNQYKSRTGEIYYEMPGGGQNQFENMEDAILREVLEETGYHGKILRFLGIAEEIYDDEDLRAEYPDYTHRILHIFLVGLTSDVAELPSEEDWRQEGTVWMTLEEADQINLRPKHMIGKISELVTGDKPVYFGTVHV